MGKVTNSGITLGSQGGPSRRGPQDLGAPTKKNKHIKGTPLTP